MESEQIDGVQSCHKYRCPDIVGLHEMRGFWGSAPTGEAQAALSFDSGYNALPYAASAETLEDRLKGCFLGASDRRSKAQDQSSQRPNQRLYLWLHRFPILEPSS